MSSLSKRISKGMAWQAISVTLSKASNILAVIILGWLLTKEQFAIYALAISASAIITSLRNGGVQPVLIQRGEKSFNRTYQYFLRYALLTNASLFLIIIAASFVYAQWYDSETVGYLMMLIGMLRMHIIMLKKLEVLPMIVIIYQMDLNGDLMVQEDITMLLVQHTFTWHLLKIHS